MYDMDIYSYRSQAPPWYTRILCEAHLKKEGRKSNVALFFDDGLLCALHSTCLGCDVELIKCTITRVGLHLHFFPESERKYNEYLPSCFENCFYLHIFYVDWCICAKQSNSWVIPLLDFWEYPLYNRKREHQINHALSAPHWMLCLCEICIDYAQVSLTGRIRLTLAARTHTMRKWY